jgi:hypothetical protein
MLRISVDIDFHGMGTHFKNLETITVVNTGAVDGLSKDETHWRNYTATCGDGTKIEKIRHNREDGYWELLCKAIDAKNKQAGEDNDI